MDDSSCQISSRGFIYARVATKGMEQVADRSARGPITVGTVSTEVADVDGSIFQYKLSVAVGSFPALSVLRYLYVSA